MKNILRKLLLAFFLLVLVSEVKAAGLRLSIDSLRIESGYLVTNVYADGLLDKKMLDGLERGFTSLVQYRIQLWRKKRLIGKLVSEQYYEIMLSYDVWNRKYIFETPGERRSTVVIDKVRSACSEIISVPLVPVTKIEAGAEYFVTVELKFEPISAEKYDELRAWLSGNSESSRNPEPEPKTTPVRKQGKGRLFGILTNLIGFGDKIITIKSNDFRCSGNQKITWSTD